MNENDKFLALPEIGVELYNFQKLTRPFPAHFHNAFLIGCMKKGKRVFKTPEKEYLLEAGDIIFLPPFKTHACPAATSQPINWLCAHLEMSKFPQLRGLTEFKAAKESPLAKCVANLLGEAVNARKSAIENWQELLNRVAQEIRSHYQQKSYFASQHANAPAFAPQEKKTTLEIMATSQGLNKFQFLRSFRALHGITPCRYLNNLRLLKAKSLLRQGDDLAACAAACGFYDQSHFSRLFKNNLGITPGIYRTHIKQSEER